MSRNKRGRGGCLLRTLTLLIVSAVLVAGAAVYWLSQPYKGFPKDVFFDLSKGTGTFDIADDLAASGVIKNRWQWVLARAFQPRARLQAGEYRFSQPASVWTVFDRIERGDVFYYEVTIPEGSNMFDIGAHVERAGYIKAADFLKVAQNPAPIKDLSPQARSLEGFLFPSTYRLLRTTTAAQLSRKMTDQFRHHWAELKGDGDGDANRVVTLASLIEKETGVAAERPRVAAVLENRIRLGIALDCDPTTIYAAILAGKYHGVIHRSDLESDSPYNTYRHRGLPPGPITNPGLASLKAALHPEQSDYLYFVARPDGSGGHNFSRTLSEHTVHVLEYRRGKH